MRRIVLTGWVALVPESHAFVRLTIGSFVSFSSRALSIDSEEAVALRLAKLPDIAKIIQNSMRLCIFRMKMTKFYNVYEKMKETTDEYIEHMSQRQARSSPAVRAEAADIESRFATLDGVMPPNSSFRRRVDARKQDMHAAFVQGHVRAVANKAKFTKTKNAALTFQSAFQGLKERRAMDPSTDTK